MGILTQQLGDPARRMDWLQPLPGPDDPGAIPSGQQVIQRGVLQVRGQQTRKPVRRQVDRLEQEWLAGADPESFDEQGRRTPGQVQGLGDALTGALPAGGQQASLGVETAHLHLLGEAHRAAQVQLDRGAIANVPRPRVRTRRCSRASSLRARRTVIRLHP